MNDLQNILSFSSILIAPVAVLITLISLRGYYKFRDWRLLFLSVAFLLFSVPPIANLLQISYTGPLLGLSPWTISILAYVSYIFSVASVLPFAILAYVYLYERRTQSIKITRNQWIIGGAALLIQFCLIIYETTQYSYLFTGDNYLGLVSFISGGITSLLVILIVISLFAYYRAKRKRYTLLVMIGFICLFFGLGYGVDYFSMIQLSIWDYYGFLPFLELAGYVAFLAALVRLRVFR
jgi:hypothetical protein